MNPKQLLARLSPTGRISLAALGIAGAAIVAVGGLMHALPILSTPPAVAAAPGRLAAAAQTAAPPAATAPLPPASVDPAIPPADATSAAPAAPAPRPGAPPLVRLAEGELDQLLAPIALYPDQLLSQLLMASTVPNEVVAAANWLKDPANRALRGNALMQVLRQRNWDPSVMALIPFSRLLELMANKIGWTQKLGEVFVAQQAEVMDAVQRLRRQAMAAGNLASGQQCQCVVANRDNVVTIAPARSSRVYLPVYDPGHVYGTWAYPLYPPEVFPLPVGFAFAPGYYWGYYAPVNVAYYWPLWGWGWFNWSGHNLLVDNHRVAAMTGVAAAGFGTAVWARNAIRGGAVSGPGPAAARRIGSVAARSPAAARAATVASGRGGWRGRAAAGYRGGGRAGHFARSGGRGMSAGFHGGGRGMHFAPAAGGGGHGGGGHGH